MKLFILVSILNFLLISSTRNSVNNNTVVEQWVTRLDDNYKTLLTKW